jgi:hypothetical protein
VEDIGTHSIRKGETTYKLSGSTASPSSVAINNQGGWTIGSVQDVYMIYEKGGDHYVGRILAGLPLLSAPFTVSEPNVWILNPNDANARVKQTERDGKVILALCSLFGYVICQQVMVLPTTTGLPGSSQCPVDLKRPQMKLVRCDPPAAESVLPLNRTVR